MEYSRIDSCCCVGSSSVVEEIDNISDFQSPICSTVGCLWRHRTQVTPTRTDMLYDCGNSLNPLIDVGQAEGAFIMGQGFYLHEDIMYDDCIIREGHCYEGHYTVGSHCAMSRLAQSVTPMMGTCQDDPFHCQHFS